MAILPKLLIAESDSALREALEKACARNCHVCSCEDGSQARALLQSFHPDILLIDLLLPQVDGLTLLREIPEANRPLTVAIVPFRSTYILSALQQMSVAYLFLKPMSLSAVADRIQELAATIAPAPAAEQPGQQTLFDLLQSLGLAPRADGFSYLLEAIPKYQQDHRQALTKELYPDIARIVQKSPACVERSIRSAIEGAWKRSGYRSWQNLFPTGPYGTVARPSNGEFIHAVALLLSRQEVGNQRAG